MLPTPSRDTTSKQINMASISEFISIPLKKTWEVDLIKPLKAFIANTYSSCNAEDYNQALAEFNKLRNNTIAKSVDKHESALEVLYRYYDQLVAIESKFPIAENQVRISFKWQDAFDKESFFAGKRTLSIASSSFEKVCLLFNIAALQSQIAEVQNHSSDDGLKLSAKLFQQSSGIFSHLKDGVLSNIQADPTPDLHPDTLNALSVLMLSQGQDCFVRKAINDKMKPLMVAKLSLQCSDLYADALKLLQLESIKSLWPKEWLSSVACKQAAYHAIAEYYQSQNCKEAKDFGEEISRLRHAKDLMTSAETRGGITFIFGEIKKKILRTLQEAEKDNDFIYHAKIPELTSLAAIGKAPVAKCIPIPSSMSMQFKDLFEKVVPLVVHQALAMFENRKSEAVNREVGRLREATQLLNSVLASLNLPAAIEDLSGSGSVPVSVLEKAATVRDMGGITILSQLINDLPALLQRNREILDEAERLLNDEEQSDKQLRDQFNGRWTRTPSEKLTESIRAEASRYRQIIDNAVNADSIVRERFTSHRDGIDLLSRSNTDIERSLPSSSPAVALQGLPCVAELKQLMQQISFVKSERDSIETQLKEANCDVALGIQHLSRDDAVMRDNKTSKFMACLSQSGTVDEEQISTEQLDSVFGPLRELVSENIQQQEAILERVQVANLEFTQAAGQNQSPASREQKLKDLAAAFDSFTELKNNLEEGTKFYNDLTQLLVKFQSKVSDFCFARKTEKDELMKDLSAGIARQPGSQPPAAPAYQQSPVVNGNESEKRDVPPPRPPPPAARQPVTAPVPAVHNAPPVAAPRSKPSGAANAPSYNAPQSSTAPPVQAPAAAYGSQGNQPAQYQTGYNPAQYFSMPALPASYNPYMSYGPQPAYAPQPNYGSQPVNGPAGYPGYTGYPPQPGAGYPTYPGYQQPYQYPSGYTQPGYQQPYPPTYRP